MTKASPEASPSLPALAAIESIHGTVAMARALAESGRRIDLGGLDADAAALCTAIALLPLASARPLRPALTALLREGEGRAAALPPPCPPPPAGRRPPDDPGTHPQGPRRFGRRAPAALAGGPPAARPRHR